jgi:hypothetical protein
MPAGNIPTIDEAKARLEHIERHGPTPVAFTFRQRFPAPVQGVLDATHSSSLAAVPTTTR